MNISARRLSEEVASGSAGAILDVRSRAEFARGHVPGAFHIPFWQVTRKISAMKLPRNERIVVYCGHGPRALIAGAALRRLGFTHIVYLKGHMAGWRHARLPEAYE
jgi:rhodanese-related sulfurtransferase